MITYNIETFKTTSIIYAHIIKYDIELLKDIDGIKKGQRIRGECSNSNDFSKFKAWWCSVHDTTNYNHAKYDFNKSQIRVYYKEIFKTVVIVYPIHNFTIT